MSSVDPHTVNPHAAAKYAADQMLAEQLVRGDGAAWQTFLQSYGRIIRARVADVARSFGRGGDEPGIEDATAEVFSALLVNEFAALRAFAGKSSLSTYVAVIATRSATRHYAARRMRVASGRESEVSQQAMQAQDTDPSRSIVDAEQRQRLYSMLDRLPEKQREVVRLFHLEGCSYAEVSSRLDMPIGSVGVTLRRGEAKLKELIEPD